MSNTLRETRTGWSVRLRMGAVGGKEQRPWLPMPAMKETDAEDRRDRLQRLATEFVRAGKAEVAEHRLRIVADQPTPKAFEIAERAARRSLSEDPEAKPVGPRTFRDVAELWLKGELHRKYPDITPPLLLQGRHFDRVKNILDGTVLPILGAKPIAEVTLEDAERARGAIPATVKAQGSRRHFALVIRRVLSISVYPLRLITHSPIPPKWIPAQGKSPAFGYLFPVEEQKLLACAEVPFVYRLLFGFICRNGLRVSEALALTRGDINLATGICTLDDNKTDDPRQWTLEPDVLRAIERHLEHWPHDCIFEGAHKEGIALRLRAWLLTAGVDRPQLHARTNKRRPLRVHDLRATFVTLALATGRTETWVMDRTGHRSSEMVNRYRRQARSAEEARLGWLLPLDECLWPVPSATQATPRPNDQGGPSMDQESEIEQFSGEKACTPSTQNGPHALRKQPNSAAASRSDSTKTPFGPSLEVGVDQKIESGVSAAVTSPGLSGETLRRLLELATRSREWGVVRELSIALEALEQGRAPNVTRLDDRRRGK